MFKFPTFFLQMVPKIHKCCEALVDNIELQSQSHESIDMKE